jgi:hypothetical protein
MMFQIERLKRAKGLSAPFSQGVLPVSAVISAALNDALGVAHTRFEEASRESLVNTSGLVFFNRGCGTATTLGRSR